VSNVLDHILLLLFVLALSTLAGFGLETGRRMAECFWTDEDV
jgi:hypothetical protein